MPRKNREKSASEIKRNMSAIRSKENRTEVALRKALFARGFRYRKYSAGVPGRPDIVFRKEKIVVFVDGDFWHARMLREGGNDALMKHFKPSQHSYWLPKFARRIQRDDYVTRLLKEDGWTVIRIWESEASADLEGAADEVATIIFAARDR